MARSHFIGRTRDTSGNSIPNIGVYVYLADTTTAASVFTEKIGGTAITIAPQITSDAYGLFDFYVDNTVHLSTQLFDLVVDDITYEDVDIFRQTPGPTGDSFFEEDVNGDIQPLDTQNVVPRATGQSSVGTADKRWGDGYFGTVNTTELVLNNVTIEEIDLETLENTDTKIPTSKTVTTALNDYVTKATYDANTILKADSDNTPTALTVAENTIVGRAASGTIDDLTSAQVVDIIELATGDDRLNHNVQRNLQGGTTDEYYHLNQDDYDFTTSRISLFAGVWDEPTLTDNGNGTYTISTGTYALYSESDGSGNIYAYEVAGGTFTPTNNSVNYLVCNYNGGSPITQNITDLSLIDFLTIIPIITIYRIDNVLDYLNWDEEAKALPNKLEKRFIKTERFVRQSGLQLSEVATRRIRIEAGTIWYGGIEINVDTFQTGDVGDTLREWVYNGSIWVPTIVTQYDNDSYQGATGKVAATGMKYLVLWVYKKVSNTDVYGTVAGYVFGTAEYSKLSDAQEATLPSSIPPIFQSFGILIGRIIIQNGAAVATQIDSAFATVYSATPVTDHNSLVGLQGGTTDEYYHLTSAQYSLAENALSATQLSNTVYAGPISGGAMIPTFRSLVSDDIPILSASQIRIEVLSPSTYDDLRDYINTIQSSGRISGMTLSAHTPADGTVDISSGKGIIKITESVWADTRFFDYAGGNVSLTDNSLNYIYAYYDSGTGTVKIGATTDRTTIHEYDQFTIGRCYRKGTDSEDIVASGTNIYNNYRRTHNRLVKKYGFSWASGSALSESDTRKLAVTAGIWYIGNTEIATTAFDSNAADTFTNYYYNGSVWIEQTLQTQLSNIYYNNVASGLVEMTANKWANFWVYLCPDSDVYVLYGQSQYNTLAEAQATTAPASVPNYISANTRLIARITFKKSNTNFTAISNALTYNIPSGVATNHNLLAGLQGGAVDDYYHLTLVELTKLTNIENYADVTDSTNVSAAGAVMKSEESTSGFQFVIDEDTMVSNLDTKVPTQQSVKAYIDGLVPDAIPSSPDTNDVIMWNGLAWVAVPEGTTFLFSIASFSDSQSTPQLIGSGQWKAIGEISFTASYTNGPPTSAYISKSGWSNLTLSSPYTSIVSAEAVNYPSVASYVLFTLNAAKSSESDTETQYVYFYNYIWYGVSTVASGYSEADVEGLANNTISNTKGRSFTVEPITGEYIIYALPTRLGTVTFWVGGFEGGFQSPETVSVTNTSGYTEDYYVYRSTNSGLGSTTVTVV